ncbi:hypothetical protein [Brucella sp. NBRC 12950]|uniref:hypothetical protein n=1 Tax=Brucella sp. NBRC 12950 TaxID=2994518 RepID=UPI0024A3F989|nr:hypothetical protein [Brucella sp. NBRC 12950]GLU25546.1 hypothetical protein Brsp01_07790 [Brucella sp. NBRC 12950]
MSIDSYYREKFNNAVYCFASPENLNKRVLNAFVSMITVDPAKFTNEALGEQYRELLARVNSTPEQFEGQGTLQATLDTMSEDELYDVAKQIISIHNELLRDMKPGEF